MSEVKKSAPGARSRGNQSPVTEQMAELAEAAFAEPGEWFSVTTPASQTTALNALSRVVLRRVAEYTTNGDTVFLRVRADAADTLT